jgi:PKD repeat protein
MAPPNYPANWPVPFGVIATPMNIAATPTYNWNFGDGSAHSFSQYSRHAYSSSGSYNWSVISTVQSGATQASTTNNGTIIINGNVALSAVPSANSLLMGWPNTTAGCLLEESPSLGADGHWSVVTNVVNNGANTWISVPLSATNKFYRLRKL